MKYKKSVQSIWGLLLIMAGASVIVKVHTVFPFSEGLTFRQIAMYILAIMLIGGGINKIYLLFHNKEKR